MSIYSSFFKRIFSFAVTFFSQKSNNIKLWKSKNLEFLFLQIDLVFRIKRIFIKSVYLNYYNASYEILRYWVRCAISIISKILFWNKIYEYTKWFNSYSKKCLFWDKEANINIGPVNANQRSREVEIIRKYY